MDTPATPQPEQAMMKRQLTGRGLGVFALVGSGVLGYLCVFLPIQSASNHEESVSLSMKGVVVLPILLVIGVINTAMGERASEVMGPRQKPSVLGWVIYITAFGLGVLLYLWLKGKLRDYGYEF